MCTTVAKAGCGASAFLDDTAVGVGCTETGWTLSLLAALVTSTKIRCRSTENID
jgi:hypothetical protein